MTRKSFSFVASGNALVGFPLMDWLCVHFDEHAQWSEGSFFDALTQALQGLPVMPDAVLVMADGGLIPDLLGYWTDDSIGRGIFLHRGENAEGPVIKHCLFGSWDAASGLIVHSASTASGAPELDAAAAINAGLRALVERNQVVQVAPAGHTFRHPSGTTNKIFIQARELVTGDAELGFAARALIRVLPALNDPDLRVVYIDSMGIYSLVRAALGPRGEKVRIESFRSYSELSTLSKPVERYAVVISASTSGGMAREFTERMGFEQDRVATVIDMVREDRHGAILIALSEFDPTLLDVDTNEADVQIELVGEHFSSKSKPPRMVTLGLPHLPKALPSYLKTVGRAATLDLLKPHAGQSRPISLDGEAVASSDDFKRWIREEVTWNLPVSIDHLIAADTNGSVSMANTVADTINALTGKRPVVIEAGSLTRASLGGACGVAVVQAVVGDGAFLREVSRHLRDYIDTDCPRHFICAVCCPSSIDSRERLKQFLVRNPTARLYGFSSWIDLPIGANSAEDSWERYREIASQIEMAKIDLPPPQKAIVRKAADRAVAHIQASTGGFLPKLDGSGLDQTDGFVFLTKGFRGLPSESLTFLIISAVLQSARELKDAERQLKPTGYESVVLAPENFQRFNDNILQVCLLRAALPSEMDYSSSAEVSLLMKEVLQKIFARRHLTFGGAALEFAAALLSGRMKLAPVHLKQLLESTLPELLDEAEPSALLGLLHFVERRV